MTKLPIAELLVAWGRLSVFSQLLAVNINKPDIHIPTKDITLFRGIIRSFSDACKQIGLPVTHDVANELYKNFCEFETKVDPKTNEEFSLIKQIKIRALSSYIDSIERTLKSETSIKVAMILPPEMISFYEPKEPLFGQEVNNKFPSMIYELNEAGKCIALGRSTAAVFHLMRLMEIALKAVGACLDIKPPASPNWFEWLKLIREERLRRNNQNKKSNWAESDFFQDVWQRLDSIKDAHRNSTMHVEAIYTPEEAKEIFDLTKGFMKKIASRMDEKGQPLA